jgi:uracil phosphoribosyltransferase
MYILHVGVHFVGHPIAQDALTALRRRDTPPSEFRGLAHRLSLIVILEATRELTLARTAVDTPLEPAEGARLDADVVVVSVLRAGLGMLDAALELLPRARVGHIGLERDEHTAAASRYYAKLPAITPTTTVLLVDPMLATGGSAVLAASLVTAAGATDLRLLCLVAAPEGLAAFSAAWPTVPVYTPAVDRGLNARKFILPGLGDFGDRLYGT